MKRNILLSGLGLMACSATAQDSASRPNVILLVADDLGYGDLSCYGATGVNTPHTDSLARSGVRFTDAHACASTSTPSRYSLLTGEYPFRRSGTDVAAGNAGMIVRPEQYTIADAFKQAGYTTAAIGKWHLGLGDRTAEQDWNGKLDKDLSDIGFDYHYIMAATADRVPCVFIENGQVANHDASAPIAVSYRQNFEGEPTGRTHPELLTKLRPSHGHDHSIVNGISRIGYMRGGGKALWQDENIADSITAHAKEFIEQHAGQPFFLYLCTNDIHVPRYPHDRFRGKSPMGLRGDAILQFDWTVGEITATLRRLGLAENTLIILTSDNGPVLDDGYDDRAEELAGEHQAAGTWRGGKYSAFEAGSTVPFIVSWQQGIRNKGENHTLVSQIDCLASLASLIGVSLPENAASDSRNQLDTWLGRSHNPCPFAVSMAANHTLSIRTKEWKYIEPHGGEPIISWGPKIETGYSNTPQLYHMLTDSKETTNLATDRPAVAKQFQSLINRLRAGNGN